MTDKMNKRLSVIVPAYNEEERIIPTITNWINMLEKYVKTYEMIIVMDGCLDSTPIKVLGVCKENNKIIPLIFKSKLGKGGALIEGFKVAKGDFILFSDADLVWKKNKIMNFLKILDDKDAVIGCRYFKNSNFSSYLPFVRLLFSRVFNSILKILFPVLKNFNDTQCGIKGIRKNVYEKIRGDLTITNFAFDVNFILSILNRGFDVGEIKINYNHIEAYSKVSTNIVKISISMLFSLIRLRIIYSKYKHYLSVSRVQQVSKYLMKVMP